MGMQSGAKFGFVALLLHVPLLLLIDRGMVDALTCDCNNGRVVRSTPQCICECEAGYQLPDCNYKNTESVRLDLYINDTAANFRSQVFLNETAAQLSVPVTSLEYRYAIGLDRFGKTNVLMLMPGYTVVRFLPLVEAQVPWVRGLKIESAYVIPIPAAPVSQTSKYPAYTYQGYQLTVEGLMWVIALLVLLFIVCFLECCCFFKNNEEEIAEHGYKPNFSEDKYKQAARLDGMDDMGGRQSPRQSPRPTAKDV